MPGMLADNFTLMFTRIFYLGFSFFALFFGSLSPGFAGPVSLSQYPHLKERIVELSSSLNRHEQEKMRLETQTTGAELRLQTFRRTLSAPLARLETLKQEQTQKKESLQKNTADLTQLNNRLTGIQSRLEQIPGAVQDAIRNLPQLEQIAERRAKVYRMSEAYAVQAEREANAAVQQGLSSAVIRNRRAADARAAANSDRAQFDEIRTQRDIARELASHSERETQALNNELAEIVNVRIPRLRRENASLQERLSALQSEIELETRRNTQALAEVSRHESEVTSLRLQLDRSKSQISAIEIEIQASQNGLNELLNTARLEGEVDGDRDGRTAGITSARRVPNERALAQGTAEGEIEGRAQGIREGYERGKQQGLRQIEQSPRQVNRGQSEYLSGSERGIIEGRLDGEREGKAKGAADGELEAMSDLCGTSLGEIRIRATLPALSTNFARPEINSFDLSKQFSHPDLKRAYDDSYRAKFLESAAKAFDTASAENFESVRRRAFETSRTAARLRAQNERYNDGLRDGLRAGVFEAGRKAGHWTGRSETFSRTYDQARSKAYNDLITKSRTEAIVKLESAKVVKTDESLAHVNLVVKNCGRAPQTQSITAELSEPSNGLRLPNPRTLLPSLQPLSRIRITNVLSIGIDSSRQDNKVKISLIQNSKILGQVVLNF